ncbi:MAG: phosphotransferase family protein [Rhizobiales bacterium]|nr:phosphotransferase family protein [Hyphomicrobiales bacterium]
MTPEEEKDARDAMRVIPTLSAYSGPIERLGGLTNRVYRAGGHVLRIPGKGTEEYINRTHEAEAARVAATAGVSPEVIHADPQTGVMATVLVPDAVTMSPDAFRSRKGSPARAGLALRRLHTSGGLFPFRFELFAMIDDYLKVLATKDVDLPDGYHDVVREADAIRAALARKPAPLVACHCDPLCENFIDTGSRMWIVDWEYSGMNDPMWDLGDLSVEAGFDQTQEMEMLSAYFDGAPAAADHGRMVIYKAMCDLLWTLWGLIQHANKNPADDFAAYALNRFNRCKTLMAAPGFARHLAAI